MQDQVIIRDTQSSNKALETTMREACKKIAPVWPLESFVAVNPYLGMIDQKFESIAEHLAYVGGIQMTLPSSFYMKKVQEGVILPGDIEKALSKFEGHYRDTEEFLRKVSNATEEPSVPVVNTLIDVATQVTEKDWNRFITSRISVWAASYFDNQQASWSATDKNAGVFQAWKMEAATDRTTEITGLKDFRKFIKQLPDDPIEAANASLEILDITEAGLSLYLHRLLLKVGGWSAFAARLDWDNELYGGKDGKLLEFLSILICWEACVYQSLDSPKLRVKWLGAKKIFTQSAELKSLNSHLKQNLILQEAFDIANQREIVDKFKTDRQKNNKENKRPKAQAIFCIDVRSEVYRRNLELVDPEVETIGFAGFFAFPINYVPIAHEAGEAQCPVLIPHGPTILEQIPGNKENETARDKRISYSGFKKLWKSFKSGAVSCFGFVSPLGLTYLPKLFTDTFGITRPVPHPDRAGLKKEFITGKSVSLEVQENHPLGTVGISAEQRVQMAKNALSAMSLTENFARFVLIAGHGSSTVNNPHATGLDCGACGGKSGEANARVAAAVLNDVEVRENLKKENIFIPEDTTFLACLHDTTTDELSIFNEGDVSVEFKNELAELNMTLARAGQATRTERAMRMSITGDIDKKVKFRSKDWSQVRPEWGLAGCSAFVVAPRERTKNIDFGGKSFLHSYDWKKDKDFSILELIMTAPMVVTSWINLQYYASTVDNKTFGAGNKTLHNVTAGIGVLEGFSGDLRVGLPLQSVHDGEKYQHEPLKLNVIIEAPIEQMNAILQKHESVRNLCDNGWIHLLAMDENGGVSHQYNGGLEWLEL